MFHGQDAVETEREARRAAEQRGAVYVSPYNDWRVSGLAGHITALEILAWDCIPGQAWFVPRLPVLICAKVEPGDGCEFMFTALMQARL